jgi:hypothetical protein
MTMRARRLLDEAKQALADDLSDLAAAARNLFASIGSLARAHAALAGRRWRASLYVEKRRFAFYLDEQAPWIVDALRQAREEPQEFWRTIGAWGDGAFVVLAAITLTLYAPLFAAAVTFAGLAIGVGLVAYCGWKFARALRAPDERDAIQRAVAMWAWRVRARAHQALEIGGGWVHAAARLTRGPSARA